MTYKYDTEEYMLIDQFYMLLFSGYEDMYGISDITSLAIEKQRNFFDEVNNLRDSSWTAFACNDKKVFAYEATCDGKVYIRTGKTGWTLDSQIEEGDMVVVTNAGEIIVMDSQEFYSQHTFLSDTNIYDEDETEDIEEVENRIYKNSMLSYRIYFNEASKDWICETSVNNEVLISGGENPFSALNNSVTELASYLVELLNSPK